MAEDVKDVDNFVETTWQFADILYLLSWLLGFYGAYLIFGVMDNDAYVAWIYFFYTVGGILTLVWMGKIISLLTEIRDNYSVE